jgi:hypothetical protein
MPILPADLMIHDQYDVSSGGTRGTASHIEKPEGDRKSATQPFATLRAADDVQR